VNRDGVEKGFSFWDDRFVEDAEPLETLWPYATTENPSQ
jgi:hypothetical protein